MNGGIARRAWARNPNSLVTAVEHNLNSTDHITLPYLPDEKMLVDLVRRNYVPGGK